jgi:hypothetical protein
VTKLINIYGVKDSDINSSRYVFEIYLDELMDILLGEGKNISMAINNIPEFSDRFTLHYDII